MHNELKLNDSANTMSHSEISGLHTWHNIHANSRRMGPFVLEMQEGISLDKRAHTAQQKLQAIYVSLTNIFISELQEEIK